MNEPQARGGPVTPGDPRPNLLFYCQHLLGIGHLIRSFALCEALASRYRVSLLCGGELPRGISPPPSVELVALPAVGVNPDWSLFSCDSRRSLEDTFELRRQLIMGRFRDLRPAAVVTELYPFGRKKFDSEMQPLLEAARERPRPIVVSSLRDILVSTRRHLCEYEDRASRLANQYFDAVLVHSDPRFARLEETFHPSTPLRIPVFHTGFVVPGRGDADTRSVRRAKRRARVVVSVGGGAVGEPLLDAAVQAQPEIMGTTGLDMRIIAGPLAPPELWARLVDAARDRPGLDVVRVVPDLVAELRRAQVSVSQCGYNTALDIVRAGVPALVAPVVEDGDEEGLRARRLQELGVVRVLPRERLDPVTLADQVRSLLGSRPRPSPLDLDGARASVSILAQLEREAAEAAS